MPSKAYFDAIAEGRAHHLSSKTYSGSFLRSHKPFLSEMISRIDAKSALDIGAGKGIQYEWKDPFDDNRTLEQAWGLPVFKHDPCWPPYEAEPAKGETFDLVLCTHTISLIPLSDLDWFAHRLFGYARRGVYIAEKIGARKKKEIADPRNRPVGRDSAYWQEFMLRYSASYPDIEAVLSLRVREDRGAITTRYRSKAGSLIDAIEAPDVRRRHD